MNGNGNAHIITISNMYEDYFLDYASYVILERAVPAVDDGLKPVQRRILHAMNEKEDGRYHKVANIIGNTMQYHPHGDAAIGAALVNLGQKELLIDTQGNWGDYRTGDSAAAPRYIEARLSKFAQTVAFNPQTTEWQLSYDGRKKEPINLPMKFPLLLAQGADGIAVGLSTKILPHNFIELIKASINILKGKSVKIYPDFLTGGSIDVSDYNGGKRGGKVKVRAAIEKADKNRLLIKDLPYGVTTVSLIDSIQKAVEKGKIKIKKIDDNTAQHVEIAIQLAPGVSPDVTIDALYAFSNCEVSISPNCCIIVDNKPEFIKVEELLKICTENTKALLKLELEIKQHELEEKWLFSSLEKIFIQNRIYHQIEECESWEEVMATIYRELKKYVKTPSDKSKKASDERLELFRDLTDDDIARLTEIRIKRISKYNSFKADQLIEKIIDELEQVAHDLEHLVEYTIAYYQMLLKKFGKGKERRTKITSFETIKAAQVVANNAKLYVDRKEGFIGTALKKEEFVTECSDIDDIIVFRKDGKFVVTRIADKTFVGKNILHVAVWKKGDDRTTYNMIYWDGKKGRAMAKRFNVTAITRDKPYDLTKGDPKSKCLYFSANPNGEAELVTITLSPACKARSKVFDYGFSDLEIKGRGAGGNIVTKYPVKKVVLKEAGHSTIGALKVWMDEVSGRLNTEGRGRFLGEFDTGEAILAIYKDGTYELNYVEMSRRYDPKDLMFIRKFDPDAPVSAVHFDGGKGWTMVKRFLIETTSVDQRYSFISDHKSSKLYFATASEIPVVKYSYKTKKVKHELELDLAEFIDVKGWRALGNKLGEFKVLKISEVREETAEVDEAAFSPKKTAAAKKPVGKKGAAKKTSGTLRAGDTVEFDVDGQGSLF
ncbi:MAG TPA: DNA gyrase/topoisomerase IV subunit A [Bacteroidetes bacterium]|nr:DNA gyrase/topoisomerase IV subunit A [Bacteroidota bacterium]